MHSKSAFLWEQKFLSVFRVRHKIKKHNITDKSHTAGAVWWCYQCVSHQKWAYKQECHWPSFRVHRRGLFLPTFIMQLFVPYYGYGCWWCIIHESDISMTLSVADIINKALHPPLWKMLLEIDSEMMAGPVHVSNSMP